MESCVDPEALHRPLKCWDGHQRPSSCCRDLCLLISWRLQEGDGQTEKPDLAFQNSGCDLYQSPGIQCQQMSVWFWRRMTHNTEVVNLQMLNTTSMRARYIAPPMTEDITHHAVGHSVFSEMCIFEKPVKYISPHSPQHLIVEKQYLALHFHTQQQEKKNYL